MAVSFGGRRTRLSASAGQAHWFPTQCMRETAAHRSRGSERAMSGDVVAWMLAGARDHKNESLAP